MAEARAVAIEAWTPRLLLLFAMAASLFWKLQALALPPHGEHAWRDADGLGVAHAFLHESWNLLLPRAAERGSLPGIVGMEFPLVNWLAAASMALFGESDQGAHARAAGGAAAGRRSGLDRIGLRRLADSGNSREAVHAGLPGRAAARVRAGSAGPLRQGTPRWQVPGFVTCFLDGFPALAGASPRRVR